MSNRTLIEINHDYAGNIERDHETFMKALGEYLRGGVCPIVQNGQRYIYPGVRVFGMRHHSEGLEVRWGTNATPISESETPTR